jgi:hypothetical protein
MLEEIGFTGPVNLSHLRCYGCRTYVYNEQKARGDKFTSRVNIRKLVGYERGAHNIYYVYIPSLHKVVRTSNVDFDESRFDCRDDDNTESDEEGVAIDFDSFYDASSGGEKEMVEESALKEPAPFETEFIDTGMPEPGHFPTPQQRSTSEPASTEPV